ESVIAAAQAFGTCVTERDLTGREDLRGIDLVTIDPPTARDHNTRSKLENDVLIRSGTHRDFC
ncbi:MAG: hypothetical protein VYE00_07210, partial [Candidatus Poribacteria bacterium]|nr:hypothetical protein [Candidatus Poribacteria bacterium]